ncbi:MAG: WecB/TagA/CpsF family glycosyltransferase [Cyanobacteria bacterium J06581_3]
MVYSSATSSSVRQKIEILPVQDVVGFPVSTLSFSQQVETVLAWARSRQSKVVCVSNVHMLMEGRWHSEFAQVLIRADLLTPDGMPIVWVTRLLRGKQQERVAGMELMLALCQEAQDAGVGIFFLGSEDEILARIRAKLMQEFPRLKVAGMISPPFRPLSEEENAAIVYQINLSGAGLVFVSLGCPKQEVWMNMHRDKVQAVMVGLGGAFSVYAGVQKWAPKWVRDNGLEWLYRLKQEPRRLWKRYAVTIPPFVMLAAKQVVYAWLRFASDAPHKKTD